MFVALFATVTGSILVLSVLSPICFMLGWHCTAQLLNWRLSMICHQLPSRCFALFGIKLAICSRCFAFYISMSIIALYYYRMGLPKICITTRGLLLSVAPLIFDGTTQILGFRNSNNAIRIITGFIAGIGTTLAILPFLTDKWTQFTIHIRKENTFV